MDVHRLLSDELSFELEVRGISSGNTVREKRDLLREAFRSDGEGNSFKEREVSDSNLPICRAKLEELSGRIQDFDRGNRENEYKSIRSRLLHVHGRLLRVRADTREAKQSKEEMINRFTSLLSNLESVYSDQNIQNTSHSEEHDSLVQLQDAKAVSFADPPRASVSSPLCAGDIPDEFHGLNTNSRADMLGDGAQLQSSLRSGQPRIGVDSAQSIDRLTEVFSRMLDKLNDAGPRPGSHSGNSIKSFNLYFDGSNMSLSCFLERVEELRISHGYTKAQLLNFAPEIFRNEALNWYRSVKHSIENWDDLVLRMRKIFLPSDYDLQLWRQLERRTQHPDEKVIFYIATIQNYFNKFNNPPSEMERVRFIRRNLLPTFQTALAMRDIGSLRGITTVNDLIEACQIIEEANVSASHYQPPPTTMRNPLEPELLYRRNPSSLRVSEIGVPATDSDRNEGLWMERGTEPVASANQQWAFNVSTDAVKVSEGLDIKCWNCGKIGHRRQNCPQPKKLHCYKCGKPDVTVRSCPSCSVNYRPSQ